MQGIFVIEKDIQIKGVDLPRGTFPRGQRSAFGQLLTNGLFVQMLSKAAVLQREELQHERDAGRRWRSRTFLAH